MELGCSCWQPSAPCPSQGTQHVYKLTSEHFQTAFHHSVRASIFRTDAFAFLGNLVEIEGGNTGPNAEKMPERTNGINTYAINTFLQSLGGSTPDPVTQHLCPNAPSQRANGVQWYGDAWKEIVNRNSFLYLCLDICGLAYMGLDLRL